MSGPRSRALSLHFAKITTQDNVMVFYCDQIEFYTV